MSEELSREEIDTLKKRFEAAGCAVNDLSDTEFEIVGWDAFPLKTYVFVNPYFIQFNTVIIGRGKGFMWKRLSRAHAFLNRSNLAAKLAKFTLDSDKPDPRMGGWFILAGVRFVTGVVGGDYDADALKNLVTLWFQDIAELLRSDAPFELQAMHE